MDSLIKANDYRLQLIATLQRLDPNGTYSDADSIADGMEPLTVIEAVELVSTIMGRQ